MNNETKTSLSRTQLVEAIQSGMVNAAQTADAEKSAKHTGRVISRLWPTEASASTPSGPVGRCRRATYYNQLGVAVDPHDINSLARFASGNMLEAWYTNMIKKAGLYHDNSIKISFPAPSNPDLTISGEIDIIYQLDGEVVGGEIKSSYGYTFVSTVFHKKTIPGLPKIEHLMQVMMYLYYCKNVQDDLHIDRFVITYIDRGSMDIIHHVVELSDEGVPIINGIKMINIDNLQNPIFDIPSINTNRTRDKLIKYQININDIFNRYNTIYKHLDSGLLIEKDYNPLYDQETIVSKARSGGISKSKYKEYQDGKIAYICDMQCDWCSYRKRCMEDSGII